MLRAVGERDEMSISPFLAAYADENIEEDGEGVGIWVSYVF